MSIPRNFICRSTETIVTEAKEILDELAGKMNRQEEHYKELREEYQKLRDEYDKDVEVAALKSEIADLQEALYRGFRISKEEDAEIKTWKEQHENEKHGGRHIRGCSGGGYIYYFVPTGIGTAGTIRCSCGAEFDFRELG